MSHTKVLPSQRGCWQAHTAVSTALSFFFFLFFLLMGGGWPFIFNVYLWPLADGIFCNSSSLTRQSFYIFIKGGSFCWSQSPWNLGKWCKINCVRLWQEAMSYESDMM